MTISIKFNRDKITDNISNNNNCTCSIVYIEPKNNKFNKNNFTLKLILFNKNIIMNYVIM
jgi:hypothetical protein